MRLYWEIFTYCFPDRLLENDRKLIGFFLVAFQLFSTVIIFTISISFSYSDANSQKKVVK